MVKNLDVMFIHPVVHRRGSALHVVMPTGLFLLASCLQEEGFETEIVNLGVEEILNPDFEVQKYLTERNPKIVGVDLHWYPHSYTAVNLTKQVKKSSDALVVVGGYTASYFDTEILRCFSSIDVILRGETELPLIELAKRYLSGKDFIKNPNSTVRYDNKIYRNPISYVAKSLDGFSLDGLKLLKHWKDYTKVNLIWDPAPYAVLDPNAQSSFDLCVSRGCFYQCSYCGGGKEAQFMLCRRKELTLKSVGKVVEDISFLKENGIEIVRMAYIAHSNSDKYYSRLFKEVQKEKIDVSCRMSLWNTPPNTILNKIEKSFNVISIDLSPDTGSERVREFNKGPYYTNDQLFHTMEILDRKNIKADLYFTVGLPKETETDFEMTLRLVEKLMLERNNVAHAYCFGVTVEPCSPIHRTPQKYGIKVLRKSFNDFYDFWQRVDMNENTKNLFGLERKDLSEAQIIGMIRRFRSEVKKHNKCGNVNETICEPSKDAPFLAKNDWQSTCNKFNI